MGARSGRGALCGAAGMLVLVRISRGEGGEYMKIAKITTLLGAIGAIGLFGMTAPAVRADISPSAFGTADLGGGLTRFDYEITVSSTQRIETGDYFTIYDFAGYQAGSAVAPANWAISEQNLGIDVTGQDDSADADSASIPNLTFTYTGVPTINGEVVLGTFSATTDLSGPVVAVADKFSGRGTQKLTGLKNGNTTNLLLPSASTVPEPISMALLLPGLAPVAMAIRRRRKSDRA